MNEGDDGKVEATTLSYPRSEGIKELLTIGVDHHCYGEVEMFTIEDDTAAEVERDLMMIIDVVVPQLEIERERRQLASPSKLL